MFAATKQAGNAVGAPDVCITPVPPPVSQAPIPYPNTAACPLVEDASEKVFISGAPAINKKSKYSSSVGDQAGAKGGVVSGKTSGKVEYTLGSFAVKIDGADAIRLTSMTTHNDNNAVGAQLVPSQTTVMILL